MTTTKRLEIVFFQTTGKKSACMDDVLSRFWVVFRHHFFFPLWLFIDIIKEKEGTFLYTHTRTEERLLREPLQREREKKKDNGEERGTLRFVSIRQKRRRKEDFWMMRTLSHFF